METYIITGYVGRHEVTSYIYSGLDYGLSHYTYNGKSYFGTVQFTQIINEEWKYKTSVPKKKYY